MRNTKKAFTLVELIVVITILAILGTIAFISLQGYSADARNSKRTNDISSIKSQIDLKVVNGISLLDLITADVDSEISGTALSIAGKSDTAVAADEYTAGTPAYTVLGISPDDFKDPNGDDYVIGATTLGGSSFQVANTQDSDGISTAQVIGTYNPRNTTTQSGSQDTNIFTLSDSGSANYFKAGDLVDLTSGVTGVKVLKVSSNGKALTLDTPDNSTTGDSIFLSSAEMNGLIEDAGSTGTGAVVELGTTYLPY